jgi:parallel beta-helix repeat protein
MFTQSRKVEPGFYTLAPGATGTVVRVDADNVTIDFQGATIQSPAASTGRADLYGGIGIDIEGHKNVTIKNVHIHGYRFNVRALKCAGLKLVDCELGQSRSQRVMNGDSPVNIFVDIRDLGAWRSYGAGAWIEACTGGQIERVTANQAQNGLLLVDSDGMTVTGCDFGYNSGWGLGLWHSSQNRVCWNQMDFCNRPWGGGWGGDSTGVLLVNDSNKNTIAYNSFTHGGDGFFLATRNGGFDAKGVLHKEGTCDDNLIAYNDGSWSSNNAFESTFSSGNTFLNNKADDSNYGFWLGYSKSNLVQGNEINGSHADGIATEQGAYSGYIGNTIKGTGGAAIHLWGGSDPKFAQSPSTDNIIGHNVIAQARGGSFKLEGSGSTDFGSYAVTVGPGKPERSGPVLMPDPPVLSTIAALKPAAFTFYRNTDLPKGWKWIGATEFGTRDYRGLLVPWKMKDPRTVMLQIRPSQVQKIVLPKGMTMVDGTEPFEKLATFDKRKDPIGVDRPFTIYAYAHGAAPQFIAGHILDVNWQVRWFKWVTDSHDAYTDKAGWERLFSGPAIREEELPALPRIVGYAAPEPGLQADHFALVATTKVGMLKGKYRFDSVSDDGIQVYVDDKEIINNWTHHGATGDSATIDLDTGVHVIRVNYCQEDGGAALSLLWTKL